MEELELEAHEEEEEDRVVERREKKKNGEITELVKIICSMVDVDWVEGVASSFVLYLTIASTGGGGSPVLIGTRAEAGSGCVGGLAGEAAQAILWLREHEEEQLLHHRNQEEQEGEEASKSEETTESDSKEMIESD
uniref:Uncharacterized protein n=1 Tax=Oryza punctata TaxID=4537 RepID=A0A0E0MDX0_ORYPU